MELKLEGTLHGGAVGLATSFGITTAINEVTENGKTVAKEDQLSARAIVMPNNVFAGYEALAARLWDAAPGTELPVYIAPQSRDQADRKPRRRPVSGRALDDHRRAPLRPHLPEPDGAARRHRRR